MYCRPHHIPADWWPLVLEPFSGGLVTASDPRLLEAGELQQCDDCMYRPNDPSLFRALGRSKLTASSIGAISGLKYCAFDAPDQDLLIAQAASKYYKVTLGGATSSLETIASG